MVIVVDYNIYLQKIKGPERPFIPKQFKTA